MIKNIKINYIKDFLQSLGLKWTGLQVIAGEERKASMESLTEGWCSPSLKVINKKGEDLILRLTSLDEYTFKFEIPNRANSKLLDYNCSFAWQDFLLAKHPEFATNLKTFYEMQLSNIFEAFDVTGQINKDEYLRECEKYHTRLTKLENGKSL